MHTLSFSWNEKTSLLKELAKPISRASINCDNTGRPFWLTLWRADGTGLRIKSSMHDLAERVEVGVLMFNFIDAIPDGEKIIDLPEEFNQENSILKLSIIESGFKAESGIIIKGMNDLKIIVVAGVMPYSIAINGLYDGPRMFEPEYQIKNYIVTQMG